MSGSTFNTSKPVYEYFEQKNVGTCYGFYFQVDQKILDKRIFCFISRPQVFHDGRKDPIPPSCFYQIVGYNPIRGDCRERQLTLGSNVILFPFLTRGATKLPTLIGEIALTAEPLCVSALESFMVKIKLEREVHNLQYKHSQEKIEQIRSNLQEIDLQLELFANNLRNLFDCIVKERNLLNSDREFSLKVPLELARRNEELQRLLAQFHQLDR
jgi:hypothetical protein